MQIYIALLRGINVGGHKKIKMAELREALSKNGFEGVQTYIQSGNILFQKEEKDAIKLAQQIHDVIQNRFGFSVPVLVVTLEEVQRILTNNPFGKKPEESQLFFTLLKQIPEPKNISEFENLHFQNEDFSITDSCVYLSFIGSYHKAKLNNNFIEKKLKVEATTRNLRTMRKLLEMANN